MKLSTVIDEYAHLDSPFHHWELRSKLIGFLVLIFAVSFVSQPLMLAAAAVISLSVFIVSGLPWSFLLRRLRYPSFFLLALLLIIPFVTGQTIVMSLGPLDLRQEGIAAVAVIAARFLSILVLGIVLFGTAPFLDTIRSMRALGLPPIMADMVLLTFRYLHEIGSDLEKMQTAAGLRGFRFHPFNLKELSVPAWLSGSLIVRSYERSEWVYKAMLLRGYGCSGADRRSDFIITGEDMFRITVFGLLAAVLVAGDTWLGNGAIGWVQ